MLTHDRSAPLTSSTTPPRSQSRRRHHIQSHSISPAASASAPILPVTTTTTITASPSTISRIQASESSASSLSPSGSPHASSSSSTATTLAPTSTVLSSSPIPQPESISPSFSKDERLRRIASQPVLVRSYNQNTSPLQQSRLGGSPRQGVSGGTASLYERKELLPVQYPAAGMFTVHAVLGSIGCSLPQLYETTFDLVEVCDAYFHTSGHLSPEAVLGKGV
ncbi:hypothetical protein V1509DRAFT_115581 [Lipomyces kononenkoae]